MNDGDERRRQAQVADAEEASAAATATTTTAREDGDDGEDTLEHLPAKKARDRCVRAGWPAGRAVGGLRCQFFLSVIRTLVWS